MTSQFTRVCVFANANGSNEYVESLFGLLTEAPSLHLSVVSLCEELPPYAKFPNAKRKERLEQILEEAARVSADNLAKHAREFGITTTEPLVLEGRFPKALIEWEQQNQPTLLIKESLPCDGKYGFASKGDIKLTRQSSCPVLLAHSSIAPGAGVVVGVSPQTHDLSNDAFCVRLINTAADWARLIGGPLFIVNAWELWGEQLLRIKSSRQDIVEMLDHEHSVAERSLSRVINESNVEGVTIEPILGRGDSVRVLSAAINLKAPGLVVIGSEAKEGVRGALLGNTAETIARRKQASVLIVR